MQAALAPKDMNWMEIPITEPPTPNPTSGFSHTKIAPLEGPSSITTQPTTGSPFTSSLWVMYGAMILLGYLLKTYQLYLVAADSDAHVFLY